jgi:YfiR/HmsC-like
VSGAAQELSFNVQWMLRVICRLSMFVFSAATIAFCFAYETAAAASLSENKLKSAYLYNFTKFVEWPPERFASPVDPLVIGFIGDDEMVEELIAVVANRQVNGRSLSVRRVAGPSEWQAVHILFVGSHEQVSSKLRDVATQTAILLVVDNKDCRPQGGSICFLQHGEKLRFEINIDTAERAKLKISSHLLKLALAVHRGT